MVVMVSMVVVMVMVLMKQQKAYTKYPINTAR